LTELFPVSRPPPWGKIILSFVPVKSMACVNGIEVSEDPKSKSGVSTTFELLNSAQASVREAKQKRNSAT
jgi:hypothetical protein